MFKSVGEPDLARLRREREEADGRYNDALTALDAAIQKLPEFPHPAPDYDDAQVNPINEWWRIMPEAPPSAPGWRGRVAAFIWNLVSPFFEKQQGFNSALVDHLNRNLTGHHETRKAIASSIAVLHDQVEAAVRFESHLIVYLQKITAFIDTKDREIVGFMRQIHEAGLNSVGDELMKRWESMVVREKRYDAKVSALSVAHETAVSELRTLVASTQQGMLAVKRELERVMSLEPSETLAASVAGSSHEFRSPALSEARSSSRAASKGESGTPDPESRESGIPSPASRLDSYKYVGFEDLFRGSQEDIRTRVTAYVSYFAGASDVVDLGCGRGEFLDLLVARGISARGVDLNHEMVQVCRERGLDVTEADALSYLESVPDQSLGGLFAAQVVEHLPPDYLLRMLEVAHHKLRPGSRIILETINPACWLAYFESYIRDLTHVRPLHPDTLRYLMLASGFQGVEIRFRAPVPEDARLHSIPLTPDMYQKDERLAEIVEVLNANVERLNSLLFTHLDYAAIGQRL
ncbi:MAG: class I SAM-dependent methyltransferase [Acidobacteria bacterium]|nr:class I SAM-dependent methyltransferase [Acidobacteriota bacterium]